jgi:tetratricopeptide (TPR) repeat protein
VTAPTDDRAPMRAGLEEERDFLFRSLRDLDAEHAAGDIDDIDYQSLRDDYTVRAAEVVRRLAAIDAPAVSVEPGLSDGPVAAGGAGVSGGPGVSVGPVRRGRRRRRLLIAAAAAVVVIGGATGIVLGQSGSSGSSASRVKNLDVAAQDAIGSAQYAQALKDYEAALKIDPNDVLTLTGEGEVLVEVGAAGNDRAALNLGLTRLESAEIADPSYGPAFGARGLGFYDEGDYAAAVPQFETYLADTPAASRSAQIESSLATAEKKLAGGG